MEHNAHVVVALGEVVLGGNSPTEAHRVQEEGMTRNPLGLSTQVRKMADLEGRGREHRREVLLDVRQLVPRM